jgi:uncharacterized protein YfaT (DUF1175 family)
MVFRRLAAAAAVLTCCLTAELSAQIRLADESDRAAFRAWFVLLADAQFERPTADVTDCAALVRHAVREAFRPHTPEWARQAQLPFTPHFAEVRSAPRADAAPSTGSGSPRAKSRGDGLPLFLVSNTPSPKYAEFADAKTLIRLNARSLGRDTRALRPADLLYFRQPGQKEPDHLMVFIGRSQFDSEGDDWVVYHTGPLDGGPGEVRKVRLSVLMQHPAPRWRPLTSNPSFIGVFRLSVL